LPIRVSSGRSEKREILIIKRRLNTDRKKAAPKIALVRQSEYRRIWNTINPADAR
jgi:hypothetical protein